MRLRLKAFAAAVITIVVVPWLVYALPPPARTYVALSIVAGALVACGVALLVVVIPGAGSNSDVKTEIYSVRAAYLCVVAGLVLFGFVAIGAVVARVMLTLTGR